MNIERDHATSFSLNSQAHQCYSCKTRSSQACFNFDVPDYNCYFLYRATNHTVVFFSLSSFLDHTLQQIHMAGGLLLTGRRDIHFICFAMISICTLPGLFPRWNTSRRYPQENSSWRQYNTPRCT
ncbi:hypothetical protein, unlikely [Trypanosoma congolense IL3000]|uniref:Uncharacterized protein n=1 Tax=Trypanosoma congolense (strain IL3000) TaxID=1068625 RepID=F9WAL8_TRYCI|nr:hypothetical protein, unlikely [Trypanosoma congolense IL3000]